MDGIVEYFMVLAVIFAASLFGPQLLKTLNAAANVGQEKGSHSGLLQEAVKGAIVLFAVLFAGFPTTLLFGGLRARTAFFRPRAAEAAYKAKMEEWKIRESRPQTTVNVQLGSHLGT